MDKKEEMKPRIVRKGSNKKGTARYILQFIREGKLRSISLNPKKLVKILDTLKFQEIIKETPSKNR